LPGVIKVSKKIISTIFGTNNLNQVKIKIVNTLRTGEADLRF